MKTACITGITGQTGSYLCDLLLAKGYKIYGLKRRSSSLNTERLDHVYKDPHIDSKLELVYGDLSDYASIASLIGDVKPDLFFNMGAQSISENSILPIMTSLGIEHINFENLWKRYVNPDEIIIEKIDNLDVEVVNIKNTQLKALGYWNGLGTWFKIKQISRHKYKGKIVRLSQKFGVVEATPNHCIFDVHHKIRKPEDNPWLLNIRNINYFDRSPELSVDFKLSGNGNAYNLHNNYISSKNGTDGSKLLCILHDDILSAFCRFIGAFVAEGHTTYNVANNSYLVGISNKNKNWLIDLEKDLNTFFEGSSCFIKHKKENHEDVWELQIRSEILFKWLRKHCGKDSHTKKLPNFIFNIERKNQIFCFSKLIEGDGCYETTKQNKNIWRYTTSSYELSCQLSLLFTMLGHNYTINVEDGKDDKKYYHFRECLVYQPNQGNEGKKLELIEYDGYVYDISIEEVENFAVGVGNIVVHNSHVRVSFDIPEYTMDVTGTGVIRVLEAIRKNSPQTRFLQASSSEMFGSANPPQNELTKFQPRSPYAVAKVAGYYATVNYREAYNIFACNAVTFNHESPKRGETFVTRKITRAATRIKLGLQDALYLGNLESKRDWSHAADVAEGMYKIINAEEADDFVMASGDMYSVKEFAEMVFTKLGLDYEKYVKFDARYLRPSEVDALCGDSTKIRTKLGWQPKYNFEMLVDEMIAYDLELANREKLIKDSCGE